MNCGVYFIACGEFIKIGMTADVAGRLEELQRLNPNDLRLLALEPMPSKPALLREKELHRRFARHRVRGEWFAAAAPILAHIRSLGVTNHDLTEFDALGIA